MISDRTVDRFWLDLHVHHPTCDPASITEALGIAPTGKLRAGQQVGTILRRSTFWLARLPSGSVDEDLAQALEDFLTFLTEHRQYLKTLISEEGEITLSINHTAVLDDGVISDLRLEPYFIQTLGEYPVGLKMQVWSADGTITTDEKAPGLI